MVSTRSGAGKRISPQRSPDSTTDLQSPPSRTHTPKPSTRKTRRDESVDPDLTPDPKTLLSRKTTPKSASKSIRKLKKKVDPVSAPDVTTTPPPKASPQSSVPLEGIRLEKSTLDSEPDPKTSLSERESPIGSVTRNCNRKRRGSLISEQTAEVPSALNEDSTNISVLDDGATSVMIKEELGVSTSKRKRSIARESADTIDIETAATVNRRSRPQLPGKSRSLLRNPCLGEPTVGNDVEYAYQPRENDDREAGVSDSVDLDTCAPVSSPSSPLNKSSVPNEGHLGCILAKCDMQEVPRHMSEQESPDRVVDNTDVVALDTSENPVGPVGQGEQIIVTSAIDVSYKSLPLSPLENGCPTQYTAFEQQHQNSSDLHRFFVDFLGEISSTPVLITERSTKMNNILRKIIRKVYNDQSCFQKTTLRMSTRTQADDINEIPLGPLKEIVVDDFLEADQIWEELCLRSRSLIPYLVQSVGRMNELVRNHSEAESNDPGQIKETNDEQVIHSTDEKYPRSYDQITSNLTSAIVVANSDNSSAAIVAQDPDAEDHLMEVESIEAPAPKQKRVRFELSADKVQKEQEVTSSGGDMAVQELFFNISDMESFANEAEELATRGKLADSDDEVNINAASDDDEQSDEEAVSKVLKKPVKPGNSYHRAMLSSDGGGIRYEDFFDSPTATRFEDQEDEIIHENELGGDSDFPTTPLMKERARLQETILAIEDANVGKKPWQLKGEVHGHTRPMNSLLESDFEHDIAVRPKAAPLGEEVASIEDIIRQRIVDGLFDDVVRTLPADHEASRKSQHDVPEISQEKPAEGLAELYEREYLSEREKISKAADAATGIVKKNEDLPESPEQAEINRLFKRLSTKLDALSSLHFAPPPPQPAVEMEVKPNVPALSAEEAIPVAVSDAALLTAREVHVANPNEARGDDEMNKLERATRRNAKKRRVSKKNKGIASLKKLEERSDPALADQRRAERTLQRPGKLLKKVVNPNELGRKKGKKGSSKSAFSGSTSFFAELQNSVENEVSRKALDISSVRTVDKEPVSSATLKL